MSDDLLLPSQVRRIAVFRALFLGDLICAQPALRALHQGFPQAEITLIGLPWAAELVNRLPYIHQLALFPGYEGIRELPYDAARTAAFLQEARATGYDLAIQMHGDGTVSNGFVAAFGARHTLGYRRGDDARLTISLPYPDDAHEALRWLQLVNAVCRIENAELRMPNAEAHPVATIAQTNSQFSNLNLHYDLPTTPAEQQQAAELLARAPGLGPLVALHTGAKDPVRRWPAERFAALADRLIERYAARIVLTGSAGECPITEAVQAAMRYEALDLTGATDLGTFAALIAQLDLLVTNDTGASHIAAATATRSVVLFGPSRPAAWAPPNRALHHVVDARALVGENSDPQQALAQLPLETVLAACDEFMLNPLTRAASR